MNNAFLLPVQIVCGVLACALTCLGVWVFARACVTLFNRMSVGRPAPDRWRPVGPRLATLIKEVLGHTSFKNRPWIRLAHWLVMLSFPLLFTTLVTGYGQILSPTFNLPIIGHAVWWEWIVEFFAAGSFLAIIGLMGVRSFNESLVGRTRFTGSTRSQARFVEWVVLGVVLCVIILRILERALLDTLGQAGNTHFAAVSTPIHFPFTAPLSSLLLAASPSATALAAAIIITSTIKILISMVWFVVVAAQPSMGVAWHRFLAFFTIFSRREANGSPALGALEPITLPDGSILTPERLDELEEEAENAGPDDPEPEEPQFGVGRIEHFSVTALLDFSTCTECGRCQDLCPAWNTGKPLSPKLMTLALRDHHAAVAPYLRAAAALNKTPEDVSAEDVDSRPIHMGIRDGLQVDDREGLVTGTAHTKDVLGALLQAKAAPSDTGVATTPAALVGGVITEDVLWSCTTCGACVDQCPVDIEHVDHIVDMRRHQVLMESAFPKQLGQMFRKMESKSNPWGMAARKRMDWAKGLEFDVPVIGEDVEDASELDYLMWVGCAGAFEDRAKKTTRALAELLHIAEVKFAVLGDGEGCTGDPARRAGNEILFQMLAKDAIDALNDAKATKIVVTCAHCFNTISREFPQLGGNFEVVHHTQLLNTLVREGRLKPVAPQPGDALNVTVHDACYLGRHNQVYSPPRELVEATGATVVEMPHNRERAMCCGGGGARAFMEETLGTRIATMRADEAAATGADVIATSCPFCTTMLSDGVAALNTSASATVAVKDVAQLMLDAVHRGQLTPDTDAQN